MSKLQNLWNEVKPRGGWKYPAILICGAFVGLFIYILCIRAYGYLSSNPATCVNCRIRSLLRYLDAQLTWAKQL